MLKSTGLVKSKREANYALERTSAARKALNVALYRFYLYCCCDLSSLSHAVAEDVLVYVDDEKLSRCLAGASVLLSNRADPHSRQSRPARIAEDLRLLTNLPLTDLPLSGRRAKLFCRKIELGDLMQISSAFGHVQDALSWFVEAFSSLADWKASINRLVGFHQAVQIAQRQEAGIAVAPNFIKRLAK